MPLTLRPVLLRPVLLRPVLLRPVLLPPLLTGTVLARMLPRRPLLLRAVLTDPVGTNGLGAERLLVTMLAWLVAMLALGPGLALRALRTVAAGTLVTLGALLAPRMVVVLRTAKVGLRTETRRVGGWAASL